MSDTPVIRCADVRVVRGGRVLLDLPAWEVRPGEQWAVLGPNGAGKSTLLSLLTGGLWATTGRVEVVGATLGHVDVRVLRRRVALVGHRVGDRLRDDLRVRDLLRAALRGALAPGLEERGAPTDEDAATVADVARECGLRDVLDQPWQRCSQGERQRVLLARALVVLARGAGPGEGSLLLLDEVTSGLDLGGREQVVRLLERQRTATATVVVAHHLEDLPATTTHALLLGGGSVRACGDVTQVLRDAPLSAAFGLALTVHRAGGRWTARASATAAQPNRT